LPIEALRGASAIDLGAGFGMHSIPLARRGIEVIAIDSDGILRLVPRQVGETLVHCGFSVLREPGLAGMVRLVATRRGGSAEARREVLV
jgi:hypothetical protein